MVSKLNAAVKKQLEGFFGGDAINIWKFESLMADGDGRGLNQAGKDWM